MATILSNHDRLTKARSYLNNAAKLLIEVDNSITPTPTPTPTPEPTPTPPPPYEPPPTPTPSPVPPLPDRTNTGIPTGTTLTAWDGGELMDGMVLDAIHVTGQLSIPAGVHVTIRNSLFEGNGGSYAVYTRGGTVDLSRCEIRGDYRTAAIAFDGWTGDGLNIWGLPADAVKLGSHSHLRNSWIHDMTVAAGEHADGVQVQNGIIDSSVENCNIYSCNNAAIFISPDLGPSTDGPLLVKGNHLDDGNYTLYCVDGNNGQYFIKNITVTDNYFGHGARYGAVRVNVPCTWSDNVYADTGAVISY